MGYVICSVICSVIWIITLYLCLRVYKNIINEKCEEVETKLAKLIAGYNKEISALKIRLIEEENEREKRGLKIKELFGKIKELSSLLKREKQRADVNNDLLNQRCKEVEELKALMSFALAKYKGEANSLQEVPAGFIVKREEGKIVKLCSVHSVKFSPYVRESIIKVFDTEDAEYNFGLAEELKEKLEETI
jgi:hypothetical protein